MKTLKFELKKFLSSKRNKYLLAIISLLIIGYGSYQTLYQVNTAKQSNIQALVEMASQNIQNTKQSLTTMESSLKAATTTSEKDGLLASESSSKKDLVIYENQLNAAKKKDINTFYRLQNQLDKESIEEDAQNSAMANANASVEKSTEADIAYYNAVENRHLNFEASSTTQMAAFGNFQQQFLPLLSSALFVVLFSAMVAITVSTSYEDGELKIYRFFGFNLQNSIINKVIAGVIISFGWLILASIIYFIIVGFVNGFGSWNYPAYLFTQTSNDLIVNNPTISNGVVDAVSILYLLPVILFIASLGALVSVISKRSLVVIGVIAILVLGYSMISSVPWVKPLAKFIPMSYFDPRNLLNNPSNLAGTASIWVGLVYLLVISIIFLAVAYVLVGRQKSRRI
ncbi:MAG: ABC transporter permease [Streptococcaceae bacterium]|jgi:ABC-2 type transport system permease protein|nr:ABC transporter permease [Streptococcaceae bacterium]